MRFVLRHSWLVTLAACSFTPAVAPGGGDDVDAPSADVPGQAVCDPAEPSACSTAQTLTACRSDGTGYDDTLCSLACVSAPAAHCGSIVPSNSIPVAALTAGDAVFETGTGVTLRMNSDSGLIADGGTTIRAAGLGYDPTSKIAFSIVTQSGGAPDIGVFSFGSFHIGASSIVTVRGPNAVAIVSHGTIVIDGALDVTGGFGACTNAALVDLAQCAGPGGTLGGAPNAAAPGMGGGGLGGGGPSGFAESGGGGGGHGSIGAIGGAGLTNNTTVGTAGAMFGNANLTPLQGGGGGGGGGNEPQTGASGATGGGGGGAIQLVSAASIVFSGASACGINAGGGGGGASFSSSGGGGGGAGGGILLEAPTVTLAATCVLAANGGGGSGAFDAARGTTGLASAQPAAGSMNGGGSTRDSGDGGAGAVLGVAAVAGADSNNEAGGGGGGTGYIHVKTAVGTSFTATGTVSPAATQSAAAAE